MAGRLFSMPICSKEERSGPRYLGPVLTSQAERCVQIQNACCTHIMVSKDKQRRRRSVISDLHIQIQCSLIPRSPPRFVSHPTATRQIWEEAWERGQLQCSLQQHRVAQKGTLNTVFCSLFLHCH